ncbi:ankyrin repeat protein [Diplodia corticola]|uniref:Ankyrin repeat protein n=1 Tax=Diplodia corticola TaxID=236234 RepID=A0A1J9QL85_9PEZI|nr:ankyrin repeat protein [Diplodia corticola]OJD29654.1 ankyrin repeat protein [Diplodia corticola]
MSTPDEILQACASQPLETVLSLLSTCPNPPQAREMASQAVRHDRLPLLQHILANTPRESLEPTGMLLLDAASGRSPACVQAMLDTGLSINLNDDRTGGVLHRALGGVGCPESFIAWLLERGAAVNHPGDYDPDGFNPDQVHCMCNGVSHGTVPILRLLVAAGAHVDGSRALHYAAWCDRLEAARFLVEECGAAVDAPAGVRGWYWRGDVGSTPLHVAVAGNSVRVAEYLLEKGADLEAKNAAGRTPLQDAGYFLGIETAGTKRMDLPWDLRFLAGGYEGGHQEIVNFLKQRESQPA